MLSYVVPNIQDQPDGNGNWCLEGTLPLDSFLGHRVIAYNLFLTEAEPFMLSSVCRWQEGLWEAVLLKEHVVLWRHRLSVRLHYGQLNTLLVFYQKEMII